MRVRGTKNDRRNREVPIVLDVCRELIAQAWKHGAGKGRRLLAPWNNSPRDLKLAAAKLEIELFSLHSQRHTFATRHLAAGLSWDDVARACGHVDTTMLHKIYGHMTPAELRSRLASLVAVSAPQQHTPEK